MLDPPYREQWTSRLSTIHSESEPRQSRSISGHSGGNGQRALQRSTIGSITSSARQVPPSLPSDTSSIPIPAPLFHNGSSPSDDSREFDEDDDVVGELQSPPLRHQRSFFSVFSNGDSRPSSRAESARGSVFERGSFMESSLFAPCLP